MHQDGSCNGLQHYAALGRDVDGARSVNLTRQDVPQDVYSDVLVKVLAKIEADANLSDEDLHSIEELEIGLDEEEGEDCIVAEDLVDVQHLAVVETKEEYAYAEKLRRKKAELKKKKKYSNRDIARCLQGHVNRKVIKQTVMTSVYGVTRMGARTQIRNRLNEIFFPDTASKDQIIDAELETLVFLSGSYLADLVLISLSEMFSNANEIKQWLADSSHLVAAHDFPMAWITPLGLPCIQPYRKDKTYIVKTVLQQMSLSSHSDDVPVKPQKQKSAFPPNFVHSLDATHMLMTALEAKREGLIFAAVHDSYWTHAGDIDTLSVILRDQFVELYSLPILETLSESLQNRHPYITFPPLPSRGDFDINEVKKSTYFFH